MSRKAKTEIPSSGGPTSDQPRAVRCAWRRSLSGVSGRWRVAGGFSARVGRRGGGGGGVPRGGGRPARAGAGGGGGGDGQAPAGARVSEEPAGPGRGGAGGLLPATRKAADARPGS